MKLNPDISGNDVVDEIQREHLAGKRTVQDAINEADRLLQKTLDKLDVTDDRDSWFIVRITKIREALADRPEGK